jgi:hypothetical protein
MGSHRNLGDLAISIPYEPEGAAAIFAGEHDRAAKESEEFTDELYKQIGRLNVELEWTKKKSGLDCARQSL